MPKKFASDTRGSKAKEAKAVVAAARAGAAEAKRSATEEVEWQEGANMRAVKRKEEEAAKRAELESRKALAAAQLAAEEAALGRGGKGAPRAADRKAASKTLALDSFAAGMQASLEAETAEARSVDAAISVLSDAHDRPGAVERHPERRMKGAYAAFEEAQLPIVKAENPGLRLSQVKNILQKLWKKSPDNPMNQEHVEFNEKL